MPFEMLLGLGRIPLRPLPLVDFAYCLAHFFVFRLRLADIAIPSNSNPGVDNVLPRTEIFLDSSQGPQASNGCSAVSIDSIICFESARFGTQDGLSKLSSI